MNTIIKKHAGKLLLLALVVVMGGATVYSQQAASVNNEGVVVQTHSKGNPDAEIVVTKFGDFQCPFCAAAAPVVDALVAEYGTEVRFEYKHLPLTQIHPYAEAAAVAAEAAGQQGAFYEFHDLLYERQAQWSRSGNPAVAFIGFAEELELDMGLFRQHMGASMLKDKVRAETQEAFQKGYRSTPTFTLNGERIPYANLEQMRGVLGEALGRDTSDSSETENENTNEIQRTDTN